MALRLRLKFQKHILTESQRLDGLKRSWILVNPEVRTISDLVSHLLDTFDLYDSCPNGILPTMDGFVLPPFEPIGMLKDAEVICVKRKGVKLVDVIQGDKGETGLLEHNVGQKQQLIPGVQLLANGEFVQEAGGYQSETDEDNDKAQSDAHEENMADVHAPAKKRKASEEPNVDAVHAKKRRVPKEPKSSKKKRRCQALSDSDEFVAQKERGVVCSVNGEFEMKSSKDKQDQVFTPEAVGKNISPEKNTTITIGLSKYGEATISPCSQPDRSGKSRNAKHKKDKRQRLKNDRAAEEEQEEEKADSGSVKEQTLNADGHQQDPEEDKGTEDKVLPVGSRSTRRKKVQRRLRRTICAAEKEKLPKMQFPQEKQKADSGSLSNKDSNLYMDNRLQEPDEDSGTDGEVVPVMIRPGHILFASPGKVREVEQHKEAKESFNWSGTMNKRKGQKWGSQLQTSSKWNENREKPKWNENRTPRENQSATERNGRGSPKEKQSKSWQNDHTVPDRDCAPEKAPADVASVDYEKLLPLTDSPVEGDIVAYRLVELSSSFCPELTVYRVGKVSWFDPGSNKIMLSPLPQYPFEFKKSANDDDEDELPETSLYNEDGSLEIEFQSLVDVRVVKRDESGSAVAVQSRANGAPASGSGWTAETSKGEGPSTQAWPIKINGTNGNNHASAPASSRQTETSSSNKPTSNNLTGANNSAPRPNPENGSNDAWEEITAALSAKKAQLLKEDTWNKNQGGAKQPWSYRAMRSGALGPTLALLRTQNSPQAN